MQSQLDPAMRLALELLWRAMMSVIPHLAAALGKPNPIMSRAARREARRGVVVE